MRRGGVLWGEAVVDGGDDDVGGGGEGVEVVVVGGVVGGADAEGAAVDVDQKGEFLGGGGGREVEADAGTGFGVDGDVFGLDGGAGVGAGRGGFGAEEALDAAVFVDAEEAGELADNLVGSGGCLVHCINAT